MAATGCGELVGHVAHNLHLDSLSIMIYHCVGCAVLPSLSTGVRVKDWDAKLGGSDRASVSSHSDSLWPKTTPSACS